MTQDITRWLAEIRTLQQQLVTAHQERDQAYKSAANWRKLYEAEAKQRREEVEQLRHTVGTLQGELSALQAQHTPMEVPELALDISELPSETLEDLRTQFLRVVQQCDRLQKALQVERQNHAETRETLTTALGEAIDSFSPSPAAIVPQQPNRESKATGSKDHRYQ